MRSCVNLQSRVLIVVLAVLDGRECTGQSSILVPAALFSILLLILSDGELKHELKHVFNLQSILMINMDWRCVLVTVPPPPDQLDQVRASRMRLHRPLPWERL